MEDVRMNEESKTRKCLYGGFEDKWGVFKCDVRKN